MGVLSHGIEAIMKKSITRSRNLVRKTPGESQGLIAALFLLGLYLVGALGVSGLPFALNLAAFIATFGGALFLAHARRTHQSRFGLGAGEGLLFLAFAFMLSRWLLGHEIEAYGLVYLVVAVGVVLASPRIAALLFATALAVETGTHVLGTALSSKFGPLPISNIDDLALPLFAPRVLLLTLFAGLAWRLIGQKASNERLAHEREVEKERLRLLEEAREFRLIHSGSSETRLSRRETEELILRDAVEAVNHTVFMTLELVKNALCAHTVVLLWFDLRNERLRIKELISESDDIIEGPMDPASGIIGGITRQRDLIALSELRPGYRGLSYYHQPTGVTEFVGLPIIEQGHLRGVLCVDRCESKGFTEHEVRIVRESADYILRGIENERMVSSIERTRFEVGRFFDASRRLNGVLTPNEVYSVALESIADIAPFDFAAITILDEESRLHRVMRGQGEGAKTHSKSWEDVAFESNQGLVSMVVENRHYLPIGGRLRDPHATVMSPHEDFSHLQSLLVLPLVAHDKPVGTLIIGRKQANQFPSERREMLEVVANQVAVTLQNARLYAQMETMAKYDALTGLANRRSFEDKLNDAMARHKRAGRSFGLVLTDIDHFKSVNDTYGHPVGDEVLRRVGKTFQELMREVDTPCRYGGEEFVLILEDTDREGARLVANRLREAIGALKFQTDLGLLQCTISMGIAMGPWDSDEPHTLVDLADQALYHSKENGRNQVSIYREVIASREEAA